MTKPTLSPCQPHDNVDDLAKRHYPGMTYDPALPQQWVDYVTAKTGKSPAHWPTKCVFGYPEGFLFGTPLPLTTEAQELLHSLYQ
jgi:hypothetical protein